MDLRLEYETFGIYQDVTLTALDLLPSVVTALFSAHSGTLDSLRIHYASTGLRISFQANPQAFTDSPVDLFPGSVDAPFSKVMVDGGPSREVVREQAPLATALQDVEDGI
jgi:hypothetical protein